MSNHLREAIKNLIYEAKGTYLSLDNPGAIKKAEKALAQDDWQPIETAPKEIEFRCILGHAQSVVTGYYNGHGWVNERSNKYFDATHFQPLPQPPKQKD